MINPTITAALITGASTVGSVILATRLQTRRINTQNRAALKEQTGEIKQHLKGDAP